MIFNRKALDERIESAVKRIYAGHGVYGCIESFKMEFNGCDNDDDFYGVMIIRYGRQDKDNREVLNFDKTIVIYVGPKDLVNYDFFEGMVYMAIDMKE